MPDLLPGDTGNLFPALPLTSMGFLELDTLFTFNSDVRPVISLDGDAVGITLGGVNYLLTSGNKQTQLNPGVVFNGSFVPAWSDGTGRVHTHVYEAYPSGFAVPRVNFDTGASYNGLRHCIVAADAGAIIHDNWSIPGDVYGTGTCPIEYLQNPLEGYYPVDGGNVPPVYCLQIDDFDGNENGIYWNQPNPYLGQLPNWNNAIRLPVDLTKMPSPITLNIQAFSENQEISYSLGYASTGNYNPLFQAGQYEANFPANFLGISYSNPTIAFRGLNCTNYGYSDAAANRPLPPRMAQDCYLVGLAGTQNNASYLFQYINGDGIFCMPTRLKGSATYAQSIWQPGLAINETMMQYGVTANYPELQLANVGFFHEQKGVEYFNVLPRNFVRYDIVQSPDLLWVSPGGNVFAVYHDNNGLYYFMVGGTESFYQSSCSNYRYPITLGGNP